MPQITFSDVEFSYIDNGETYLALEDINLHIQEGEFVCLVGHSGCGKSTLLSLIAGLQTPTKGTVAVDGVAITGPGSDRSIVFQNYSLFPWQTALKNVMFVLEQTNKGMSKQDRRQRAMDLLEQVEMKDAANRYPFQLSGGMRQRVAIARALAVDAPIMLLDEPFGALDPLIRSRLQNLLIDLWDGGEGCCKTAVFVTHDIDEALVLADRIVFMEPKHIIEEYKLPSRAERLRGDEKTLVQMSSIKDEVLELFDATADATTQGEDD